MGVITDMPTERQFSDVSPQNRLAAQLNYLYDSGAGVFRPVQKKDLMVTGTVSVSNSTPSGNFGVCLPVNPNRYSFFVKNLAADGAMYVKLGAGVDTGSYNYLLKTDDVAGNGNGGEVSNTIWKGEVSCSGVATTSFIAWEL